MGPDGLPEATAQRAQVAIDTLWTCVRERFTGSVVFEFTEGNPVLYRLTAVHRLEPNKARPGGEPRRAIDVLRAHQRKG